jgi:hypothetical protein
MAVKMAIGPGLACCQVRHCLCTLDRRVMMRRLLMVLLVVALLPFDLPTGSSGSTGAAHQRRGTTAEHGSSHGPIAAVSEALMRSGAAARVVHHHQTLLQSPRARRVTTRAAASVRRSSESLRTLRQGSALIPLRI